MVNVRLKEDEVAKIDRVAEKLGQTRSAFIRRALTESLARYTGDETPVTGVRVRGKEKAAPARALAFPDCPRNTACKMTTLPTKVKLCQTCGLKW